MPTVSAIARALEAWAPRGMAADFDNVGLLVGDSAREVTGVLVALDLTPTVVAEARKLGAEMIVTHHPLLFKPQKRLVASDPVGALVLKLAEAGIAYYAAHTNLDAAPAGVSFALAAQLGIEDARVLVPQPEALVKLVSFVPRSAAMEVRAAMAGAGAGHIGDYEACAFTSEGTGYFRPGERTTPSIGTAGGPLESVDEVRIEVEVTRWDLRRVLSAMRAAHPYEEVAYDVYPLEKTTTQAGYGAIGALPVPLPLRDFLAIVQARLNAGALRYAGSSDALVRSVAVCGGSGSRFISDALRAGADAFVTADVTYHTFFDVLDAEGRTQMALIDPGHYETERITERILVDYLATSFSTLAIHRTEAWTSPIRTFSVRDA
ncbi:MAG: Nif3-like dinuclear metal center hexameric protein [Bacteroidota bacterium]